MIKRALFTVVALGAADALACPVCGQVSEQGQGAYLFMTGIMSLLPLALMGSLVGWVAYRVRLEARRQADEARTAAPESTEPT